SWRPPRAFFVPAQARKPIGKRSASSPPAHCCLERYPLTRTQRRTAMKSKLIGSVTIALTLALAALTGSAAAQNASPSSSNTTSSPTRTDKSIEYHNGAVLTATQHVYLIWYGDWASNIYQQLIVADL